MPPRTPGPQDRWRRSAVETVFAGQKHRFGLFVRTIGLARARTKIALANLAYNLKRFLWIEGRPVLVRDNLGRGS